MLAAVHLVGIPLDGTCVKPARSLGPALSATAEALSQLWAFVLAPLRGAALAAVMAPLLDVPEQQEPATAPATDPTGARVPTRAF